MARPIFSGLPNNEDPSNGVSIVRPILIFSQATIALRGWLYDWLAFEHEAKKTYEEAEKVLGPSLSVRMSSDLQNVEVQIPEHIERMDTRLTFAQDLGLSQREPGKMKHLVEGHSWEDDEVKKALHKDDMPVRPELPRYTDRQNWNSPVRVGGHPNSGLAIRVLQAQAQGMKLEKGFESLWENNLDENIYEKLGNFTHDRWYQILGTYTSGGNLYKDNFWFRNYVPEAVGMNLSPTSDTLWETLAKDARIGQALYANVRGLRRYQMLKQATSQNFLHFNVADAYTAIAETLLRSGKNPSPSDVDNVLYHFNDQKLVDSLNEEESKIFKSKIEAALDPKNQKHVANMVKKAFEFPDAMRASVNLEASLRFVFDTRRTAYLELVARRLQEQLRLPVAQELQSSRNPRDLSATVKRKTPEDCSPALKKAWNRLNHVVVFSAFKAYLKDSYFPKLFEKELKYDDYDPASLTERAGALNLDARSTLAVGDQVLRLDRTEGFAIFYWLFGAPHRTTPNFHPLTCFHQSALPNKQAPLAKLLLTKNRGPKGFGDHTLYFVADKELSRDKRYTLDRPVAHVFLDRSATDESGAVQLLTPSTLFRHQLFRAARSAKDSLPKKTQRKLSSTNVDDDKILLDADLYYYGAMFEFDHVLANHVVEEKK